MDSSYHVQINMSVKGVSYVALVYIVYIRERYCFFSLVCTSKKAFKLYEVKVDVQKGPLKFREKIDDKYVNFIHFTFSSIVFIWS